MLFGPQRGPKRGTDIAGHRLIDLDEMAALTALHLDRTSDDLFVGDLVLRLAARAEKLHSVANADAPTGGTAGQSSQTRATFTTSSVGGPELFCGSRHREPVEALAPTSRPPYS